MGRGGSKLAAVTMVMLAAGTAWGSGPSRAEGSPQAAPPSVAALGAHLRFLSSDLLEGRGIGTRGGRLAAAYIETVFRAAGLEPAYGDSYRQPVPMTVYAADPTARVDVTAPSGTVSLTYGTDFAGLNFGLASGRIEGEPLFVGYGITAPDEKWDDYKDTDVRGRILIGFVNEPGRETPDRFAGKALTIYGRWTTKYEEAARRGAAAMILIHTDADAGYDWDVVRNSWAGEAFRLTDDPHVLPLQLWITEKRAREILSAAGLDLDALRTRAERPDFRPVPVPVRLAVTARLQAHRAQGTNVVGVLPGTAGPEAPAVVLCAHYDHFGVGNAVDGDDIYNGAVDNGSALAVLLGLAQSYGRAPARDTLVFAAWDAEEEGLLGSAYYTRHPAVPLARTLAAVNFEMSNVWGPTTDALAIGADTSDLESLLRGVLARRHMTLTPDDAPEQGFFFRSDQASLVRAGVPAVWLDTGFDVVGRPAGWGREQRERYRAHDYHKPSDEFRPGWDLRGLEELGGITIDLVQAVERAGKVDFKPGSPFSR